jgi:hypothetical protein
MTYDFGAGDERRGEERRGDEKSRYAALDLFGGGEVTTFVTGRPEDSSIQEVSVAVVRPLL